MKIPDIDVSSLKIASSILENHQDKVRSSKDTTHLSEAQQDINKLIEYYE